MKQTTPRHRPGLHRPDDRALRSSLLGFASTCAVLLAGISVVAHLVLPDSLPMEVAKAEVPPSGHYLAHGRAGHVDHHVLYHGLDPVSTERLASADVVWLGNSRLLFALNRQALRSFFTPRGLSYFVLGFGHDEPFHFPSQILDRHEARPKVVVVNVDEFFVGPPSDWATRVTADSAFDGWKWWFESEASHYTRRLLHAWVPHWPDLLDNRREIVVYRSQLDGSWLVGTWPGETGPLPVAAEAAPPTEERIANAERFVSLMRSRGTEVIFCLVPSPRTSRATAMQLAEAVGVPLVAPELDNPLTIDGSHLAEESATQFAKLLLDALEPHIDQLGP